MDKTKKVAKNLGYVSFVSFYISILVSLFVGYLFGWHYNSAPDSIGLNILIVIILAVGMRYPIRYWEQFVKTHKEETDRLLQEIQEEENNIEKVAENFIFTSEDFDDNTQALIYNIVKKARKNKVRVTGEMFIKSILKGIK